MKKLLVILVIGSFTILCAQGSIINTLGTNDATSGLIVTNPDGFTFIYCTRRWLDRIRCR